MDGAAGGPCGLAARAARPANGHGGHHVGDYIRDDKGLTPFWKGTATRRVLELIAELESEGVL